MTTETPDALLVELQRPTAEWVAVGVLSRSGERSRFESLPSYWSEPERPVLAQILEERGAAWSPTTRVALPNWFSHLLPEGRLREAIAEAAGVKPEREFHLLAHIGGEDLPGAIRVRPATGSSPRRSAVADDDRRQPDDEAPALKFSLAGLQLKFSIRAGERGLTVPAAGETGRYIAKLPDSRPGFEGVPEAELAGLEVGRAIGIDVPAARLVPVSELRGLPPWASSVPGRALLVTRFDRKGETHDDRVHIEELAQVLDVSTGHHRFKYRINFETVARVTAALCGPGAVASVIDRIVLNILIGNGDAHAKNWAYVYRDGQRADLSPLYDVVPTALFIADDDLGPKLGSVRHFHDVTTKSFDRLAQVSGWTVAEGRAAAVNAVERIVASWEVLGDHLPPSALRRLTARRDSLPLVHAH